MAKKSKAKRPRTARIASSEKKVKGSKVEKPYSVNAKERDKMLSDLLKSEDVDVKHIALLYDKAPKEGKEKLCSHFEVNGNEFVNSVFRGDRKKAKELASEDNAKVI